MLESHSDARSGTRRYRFGFVASVEQIPTALESLSKHFVLFLAADATSLDDATLRRLARVLLSRGLAYLCAWGPDCSRVHDQFDLERDPNESEGQVVMTTWHDDESLPEALWFFASAAFPDERFASDCTDWVAIAVGNESWEREFREQLTGAR